MAVLTGKGRAALPDSAFAYIEPGKPKVGGKTEDKYRHYPVHDANHVKAALSRIGQGDRFAKEAKSKVLAAAKEHGVEHDEKNETGRSLESLWPEVRFVNDVPQYFEARSADGAPLAPHITGYAAVFGKLSRKLGGFFEVIEPRAFDASCADGFEGVVCRYNHKDDMVLGTTRGGTLKVSVDERGMQYDVIPPKTREDVLELVQRGDVRFSSFAFRCLVPGEDDTWGTTEWGQPLRHLRSVQVVDCAPVLDPAYFDTSAAARSMIGAEESLARWVNAPLEEVRTYLAAGQAHKFFRRTDRPAPAPAPVPVPSPDPDAGGAREIRMLDDETTALRSYRYDNGKPAEAPEATEGRQGPTEEEIRARSAHFMAHENLCRKWVHGEPCVRPAGHQDDCNGPCWGRSDGLPCSQPSGHEGEHEPMAVTNSRAFGDESVEQQVPVEPEGGEKPEVPEATPEGEPEEDDEVPAERQFNAVAEDAALTALRMRQLEFERLLNA